MYLLKGIIGLRKHIRLRRLREHTLRLCMRAQVRAEGCMQDCWHMEFALFTSLQGALMILVPYVPR